MFFLLISENFIPLFRPEYVYWPDSGNSGNSGRNKPVHNPKFFMTCSVSFFGTDRNIPVVPAGTEQNLKPWFIHPKVVISRKIRICSHGRCHVESVQLHVIFSAQR